MTEADLGAPVGRVPPADLDSEAAVVSSLVLMPEAFDEVQGILRPEHCYSNANALILRAVWALHEEGKPTDQVSVASWLRDFDKLQQIGGTPYLAQVVDCTPAILNVENHARRVAELWRLRQLISECQRTAGEGYGSTRDVQAFIDHHEQAVFSIAHAETRNEIVPLSEIVGGCFQTVSDAHERGSVVTGLALGLSELDRKTSGAHPGNLWYIAGRPGMGKTGLATTFALSIAKLRAVGLRDTPDEHDDSTAYEPGDTVAYFSLEMSKEEIGNRLLSADARVDLSRIRCGQLRQDDWAKLTDSVDRLSKMPIWVDDTAAISLLELRAKCRRLKVRCEREGRKLGVVIVDYLGLMNGERERGENREAEVSRLSRGLKQFAKELAVPVLVLCQLNRDCEKRPDKRPQLSDLRDSGGTEQDADVVLFVYRDEEYHKDSPDRGIAELILAKQRNGATGLIKAKFTNTCARFDGLLSEDGWDDRYDGPATDYPESNENELRYP
jgi:replicative DNA helicase